MFEILGISLEVATNKPIGLTKDKQGGPAFYIRSEEGLNRLYCRLVIRRVL